jgi:hypothetical protein
MEVMMESIMQPAAPQRERGFRLARDPWRLPPPGSFCRVILAARK